MKKKSGDGFPLDVTGRIMGKGFLVFISDVDTMKLRLGFIKKFGKGFADVEVFTDAETHETLRIHEPHDKLIVVEPSRLDSHNSHFEAVKMAAALDPDY